MEAVTIKPVTHQVVVKVEVDAAMVVEEPLLVNVIVPRTLAIAGFMASDSTIPSMSVQLYKVIFQHILAP